MRLKSLRLAGFKSFANPTTFYFRHDITAIVGPNGCGKSNVIDAIRWVLGESSAKQLRGGAMSDVIFAGTQDKTAKSLASVELTFEHTQDEQTGIRHELNLYHELSVRRQINKEGKSDYFINGTRCRRRDVVDIFLGTGLGARSYAVIEQGMIGRIIDSSPMQLREFIEESAGISRYQARREETAKQLTHTQDNLNRLLDLQNELQKQQKSLEKQASTAKQYQAIQDQLTKIEHAITLCQLYQAKSQFHAHQSQQTALQTKLNQLTEQSSRLQTNLDKINQHLEEEHWLKDKTLNEFHQAQLSEQQHKLQLEQTQNQIAHAQKQQEQLTEQIQNDQNEITQLQHIIQEEEIKQQQKQIELDQQTQNTPQQHAQHTEIQNAWHTLHQKLNQYQDEKRHIEQKQAINTQAQKNLEQQLQKLSQSEIIWQKNWQNITDPNELEQALTQINAQLNQIHHQQEHITDQIDEIEPEYNAQQTDLKQAEQQIAHLKHQHALHSGEYDTLHKLVYPPKSQKNTQNLTNQTPISTDPTWQNLQNTPTLGDGIELTDLGKAYANLLDLWLEPLLSAHPNQFSQIFTDPKIQQNFWQIASNPNSNKTQNSDKKAKKTDKNTKTPPILLNTDPKSDPKPDPKMGIHTPNLTANTPDLLPLSQLIRTPKIALFDQLFIVKNNLQDQQNFQDLQALITQLPHGTSLLLPSGWLVNAQICWHLHTLTDSHPQSHTFSQKIQQQNRLADLEETLNHLEDQIEHQEKILKHKQQMHHQQKIQLDELKAQAHAHTHQIHQWQQERIAKKLQLEQHTQEKNRLTQEQAQRNQEKQELTQKQTELHQEATSLKQNLQTLIPQIQDLETQKHSLKQQRAESEAQIEQHRQTINTLKLALKEIELSKTHHQNQQQKLIAQSEHKQKSQNQLTKDLDRLQKQLPDLQNTLTHAQTQSEQLQQKLAELDQRLNTLKQDQQNTQTQLTAQQTTQNQIGQSLAEQTTQLAINQERIEKAHEQIKAHNPQLTTQNIQNQMEDYIAQNLSKNPTPEVLKQHQDHLIKQQKNHKQQIDKIGAVNLTAVAELTEINTRLDPLNQQISDIEASINTLQNAISTIDEKNKALFLQTLNAVNEDLNKLFQKIFGGGQASLTLIQDETLKKSDQWQAGLELMAQPKGKKNSRLAVLSGGEKTLTALSLIFAIFKQHPAPFCVLDEVDAPLDDANVGRFTSLIDELAQDVQFIFISHNKLAMQTAQELKGITMPTAGISKLVTVTLEEAQNYLEP